MFKTFALLKVALLSFVTIVVSGCAPPNFNYLYKADITFQTKDTDAFECTVESTQAIPANYETSSTSGYTTPVSCTTGYYSGNVRCTGGRTVAGKTKTVDANSGLRDDYFHRCMAKKGYKTIVAKIWKCGNGQIPAGIPNNAAKIHAPVEGACWIDGTKYARMIILPSEQP